MVGNREGNNCGVWPITRGRDSVVSIATRYKLDSPGIESRWGRGVPHPPTQPPVQWVTGLSRGESGRGVTLTTHPSSTEVKKRVVL
jgi:hypothetical protein